MIIELLLNLIYKLLDILLIFEIPQLPHQVTGALMEIFGYLESGASLLANYVPLPFIFTMFGVILAVDVGLNIYHFVMWIIKKIPMLGVK